MRRLCIVSASVAMLFATSANPESIYKIAPKMREDVACMYAVLQKMPGIDHVKLGAVEWEGWVYPYLEFRARPDRHGNRNFVHYEARPACTDVINGDGTEGFHCAPHAGPYSFMTLLPGVFADNEPGPDDWGTSAIEKRWKAECRVEVWAVFV